MDLSFHNSPAEIEKKLSNSYTADHPFTKTIINTIRNESKERLFRFLKSDPYFLDRHFQLYDVPDKLTGCSTDRLSIFRTKTILYFDPLCIAIYFRKTALIKYILDLGGNVNHENYATGIFSRGPNTYDFMQFPPLCVVIRREFIDGLVAFLQHFSLKLEDTRISTFYLNSEIERVVSYDDILSYTITVLKVRNNYPLKRLVSVLLRHEIQVKQIGAFSEEIGELTGLFLLKLSRATLNDSKLRMIATLITALEQVVNGTLQGKNAPQKIIGLAKLKEEFCSDLSTHYNFTGLVCLHVLYQRCLEWGRIGFDRMIISLINNLLYKFSWRPIFLDPTCQSDILNLMHITSSNLSIDSVEQHVFLKITKQVSNLKEEEESKMEWISMMKKKYNAHRGTYSKEPNMKMANDINPTPASCNSQSSDSRPNSNLKMSALKLDETKGTLLSKASSPEPSKPRGLPEHLLIKSIPYWDPKESNVDDNNDNGSSEEEECARLMQRKTKKRNKVKESMRSIVMCKTNLGKNSTNKQHAVASSELLNPPLNTNINCVRKFKHALWTKNEQPSCSASYPMDDNDIMGPIANSEVDVDIHVDANLDNENNPEVESSHNLARNKVTKEKRLVIEDDRIFVDKQESMIYSPNKKNKPSLTGNYDTNQVKVSIQKKFVDAVVHKSIKSYDRNNSKSSAVFNKPCILHPRDERFQSSCQNHFQRK